MQTEMGNLNYWYARVSAIQRTTDQGVLADLATHDESPYVRAAAATGLKDEAMLATIATTDPCWHVRLEAAGNLSDQMRLKKIALSDPDREVREKAIGRLTDPETLDAIARSDRDPYVRFTATSRLDELGAERKAEAGRNQVCLVRLTNELKPVDVLREVSQKLMEGGLAEKAAEFERSVSTLRKATRAR